MRTCAEQGLNHALSVRNWSLLRISAVTRLIVSEEMRREDRRGHKPHRIIIYRIEGMLEEKGQDKIAQQMVVSKQTDQIQFIRKSTSP